MSGRLDRVQALGLGMQLAGLLGFTYGVYWLFGHGVAFWVTALTTVAGLAGFASGSILLLRDLLFRATGLAG